MKKICFIYIFVICFIVNGKAQNIQPNWVFQTPQSGNSSYVARDYILLKPGFSYKAKKAFMRIRILVFYFLRQIILMPNLTEQLWEMLRKDLLLAKYRGS